MANDRHYYLDGEEQLWRVAEGQPPRLYTHEEGWQRLVIWGMGIASHDVTGDGLPEVYLTSQGDNKLQTLANATGRPTYRDIAIDRGVTATRPYTGGDPCPRRHGIPSSRTSTTTGSSTCSSPRATSRPSRTSRPKTRAAC